MMAYEELYSGMMGYEELYGGMLRVGKIQVRCGGDAGEIPGKSRGDPWEIQGRFRGNPGAQGCRLIRRSGVDLIQVRKGSGLLTPA